MSTSHDDIRVVVNGAAGRMGQAILTALADTPGAHAAAAIELPGHPAVGADEPLVIGDDMTAAVSAADVVIDFTTPESTLDMVAHAARAKVACVIGTTGFSPEQRDIVARQAKAIPIVMAPNMSIGINLMLDLIHDTARRLGDDYDIELVEIHHNHKKDAPSGTALRMAEVAATARGTTIENSGEFTRHGLIGERRRGSIGVQTLRGGDVVGEHTIIFAGPGERLEITHRAQSRQTFARGAVRAAMWVVGRKPGLYSMRDVLGRDALGLDVLG